ncbi:cupin domain-containing protein [Pseudomonadota bacterium]
MAFVVKVKDAKKLDLPGRLSREVVSAEKGADSVTLRLVEIAVADLNESPRSPHRHLHFEECIYVLAGQGTTRTDSGEHIIEQGDTILIPPGEWHVTRNTGSETLKLLCFFPVSEIDSGTFLFQADDSE